jgi:hypothetical protein
MPGTLEDIFHNFNPEKALSNGDLEKYYVEIEKNGERIRQLKTQLKLCLQEHEPVKLLFMGHRGSGKSTALNKLVAELDDSFFIVYYDIISLVDPNDVSYTEVLLSMLARFIDIADAEDIGLSEELTQRIDTWGRTLIKAETSVQGVERDAGVGGRFKFAELFSRIKNESETRTEIRKEIKPRVSGLINIINDTIAEIEINDPHDRQVLIIIDNLEKVELENAAEIFAKHSIQLTQLLCNIIYTFPIALRSSDSYTQIRFNYSDVIMYPNIKICDRNPEDGKPPSDMVLQNREFMKTMFDRRGNRELIEPEALEYAIEMSGGLVREYIRIIRDAALNSIAFGKESIDMDCVQDVINDLKNAYRSQLSDEDYETLESVIQTKQIKRDKILVRLLNNLSVLEYAKGGFDVNPVVRLIME